MSHEDRDWYKVDRARRDKLVVGRKHRWRWPYRLRSDLPWWISEPLRIALFVLPFVLAYYAWKYFR